MSLAKLHVDLAQFERNIAAVQTRVTPAQLMLVVKDDAYAQGVEQIAARAVANNVNLFGSFDVPTGVRVRKTIGPGPRIFAWQTCGARAIRQALEHDIDLGVGDAAYLDRIAAIARAQQHRFRVHLKIDTGLHRNGIRIEQWPELLAQASTYQADGLIAVVGVWSHIAEASDEDDDQSRAVFDQAVLSAQARGFELEYRHLAASAASFARPEFRYDAVRIGAFCYGIRSAEGVGESELGVYPISTLKAPIVRIDGDSVVLGVGSLDGLPSTLSRLMHVESEFGTHRVRQIGLDETCLDWWTEASAGDWVTVFGGRTAASATDLAERIDTVGEELLLRVSPLIERVYAN